MRAIRNIRDAEIEISQLQDRLLNLESRRVTQTIITQPYIFPPRITKPIRIDKLDLGKDFTINTDPVNIDLLAASIAEGLKLLSGELSINSYGTEFKFVEGVLQINGVPLNKAIYETVGAGLIITEDGVKFGASNIDNMVFNRSFEDGFEEWSPFGDYDLNTSEFKSGVQSAEIKGGGFTYSGFDSKITISLEGDMYYARAWVKSTADVDGSTRLAVRFLDSDRAYLTETSILFSNPETDWVDYEIRGTAPVNAAFVEAIIYSTNQTAGSWYIDDVYLTPLIFSAMLPDGVINDGNMINSSILGDALALINGQVTLDVYGTEFKFVDEKLQMNGIPLDKVIASTMEEYFEISGGKFKVKALGLTNDLIKEVAATKVLAGTLIAGVVYAGNITVGQIQAGTLSANVILASNIQAVQITAGTFAVGVVYAGNILVAQITAGTLASNVLISSYISAGLINTGVLNCGILTVQNLTVSQVGGWGGATISITSDLTFTGGADIILASGGDIILQGGGIGLLAGALNASLVQCGLGGFWAGTIKVIDFGSKDYIKGINTTSRINTGSYINTNNVYKMAGVEVINSSKQFVGSGGITTVGDINTTGVFKAGGVSGASGSIPSTFTSITVSKGIITGWS